MWSQAESASPAPLSLTQVRVLYVLEQECMVNLRTLAEKLNTTPSAVSRMCDRLGAAGFIDRDHNPADRRELELRISRRGADYLAGLRARREEILSALLEKMTPLDRAALVRGLSAVQAAAEKADPRRVGPAASPAESA
ncbi:MarR family transcriptional regulator [Streptomyces erythrochromogenes]|uniref:MarR family transcriptional regulator n=2 Tax=Streptomyces erythrochromogenes TaxID=285574 RepID=A0ABZ1QMU7_9ACTN|nr:MarR family transcriptional regulator [Streptomyces erythrochromogenes]MCX5583978.1 MarR family transcriptional regulator [Streptomyces erythrochromogenes]